MLDDGITHLLYEYRCLMTPLHAASSLFLLDETSWPVRSHAASGCPSASPLLSIIVDALLAGVLAQISHCRAMGLSDVFAPRCHS